MKNQLEMGLTLLLALLLSLIISSAITIVEHSTHTGNTKEKRAWQAEAVNVGHAEWIVDKKGNLKFKWLATQTAELGEKNDFNR